MLPVHLLLPVLHKPDLLLPGLLLPVPDLHNHSGSEDIRSMPDSVLPTQPAQLLTAPDTVFPAHPAMPGMLPLLLQFLLLLPRVSHPVEDRMHSLHNLHLHILLSILWKSLPILPGLLTDIQSGLLSPYLLRLHPQKVRNEPSVLLH